MFLELKQLTFSKIILNDKRKLNISTFILTDFSSAS